MPSEDVDAFVQGHKRAAESQDSAVQSPISLVSNQLKPPRKKTNQDAEEAITSDVGGSTRSSSKNAKKKKKKKKVNVNLEIGAGVDSGTDQPESERQKPKTRRGARGKGAQTKESNRDRKAKRQAEKYREDMGRQTLQLLQELGRSPTTQDLDNIQRKQILELVKGHRLTAGDNEVIHSFDVTEFSQRWRKSNNLAPDARIFESGAVSVKDLEDFGFQIFDQGQVYGYEKAPDGTRDLVFSAVFRPFATMNEELLDRFRWLGGWFAALKSRMPSGNIKNNSAHRATGAVGFMWAQGWRAGMDKGMRFGWYADRKSAWHTAAENHGDAAKLYNDLYRAQAPREHGYARKHIASHRLPSFGQTSIMEEDKSTGSNLTITCGDFSNGVHIDADASDFTFGIWFPTTDQGELVLDDKTARSMTQGGHFFWADFGFAVDFGRFAGVVSLTWRGPKDRHATAISTTQPGYLRWGTSIQIARALEHRVELFWKLGGEHHDYYSRSKQPRPPGYTNVLKLAEKKEEALAQGIITSRHRVTKESDDQAFETSDAEDYGEYSSSDFGDDYVPGNKETS